MWCDFIFFLDSGAYYPQYGPHDRGRAVVRLTMSTSSSMPTATNIKVLSLSASNIADYFIRKGTAEGRPLTNKKLQKLLYYAQAWSLAIRNEQLFPDKIEAWVHGPAIKEIYLAYRSFGSEPIKKEVSAEMVKDISSDVKKLLDEIWTVYGKFDGNYLEQLTHSELPWQKAREGIEAHVASENEISPESMREYYKDVLEKNKK